MRIGTVIRATDIHPATIHFRGFPPELDDVDDRTPMEWPAFVVIGPQSGGIFLTRHTSDGTEVGDTWHPSVEEAKEQAIEEFGDLLGEWREVPDGVPNDALAHYLEAANQ